MRPAYPRVWRLWSMNCAKIYRRDIILPRGSVIEAMKGNRSVFAVLPVTLLVMLILLMVQLRSFSRMMLALLIAPSV